MAEFHYQPMFPLGEDKTEYYLLTDKYVSVGEFEGHKILKVEKEGLTAMANAAFRDVSFLLRRSHNEQVAKILTDPEASANDKYVALTFLRNAEVAAKGQLPLCQDTGTAIIHGEKGQQVWTGFCDEEALSLGVFKTYTEENLRYSQNAPLTMYDEVNTKCNLPAQIDIEATEGMEYKFLCVTKGGGSANKTYLYQETKARIQNPDTLVPFLIEKMKTLGTAACPPYHIAFVIGGTSAEKNLLTVKLASTHYYDELPTTGNEYGRAFRDVELEKQVLKEAHNIGLGAQFGGKYMAHDIRIIRLPRHGASCPIGLGVSCSADRNIKCKINEKGIWIEKMDDNPGELIPAELRQAGEGDAVKINLNQPMADILKELTKYPVSTRLSLNGTIIVGRDIAHAKLKARLDAGEDLPQYIKDHPIYYAGPAKTPAGMACGSMGPTTAGRMDPYVDEFQDHGGSLIMLAKGNRAQCVTDACKKHGGFYLGSIGGPAAILAQNNIKSIECVEYPELGMEAIWKIEVENFPAFILVDDKGNDFFKQLKPCNCKA
ncbi:MAG: fumarate hydratase [Bacteroidales bacterium]|nr:fumarate hydratase [Bacteroidales bacterium]